ncbi:hypothetical protein HN51_019345 [Arachis hypogaea]|uniref:CGL160/ATPI domain-containing protein n=1 Tax=Arachis hypogaea TaxID=3818 RepID=A0A445BWI6_ARAHY|nr:uncharacterized protein LOC112706933 [Arachis hypogaea]QHO31092.1 uncharacterized protein DS421_8g238620 [Arachis hypogaea]RYR43099.1 hypothetical protein Ahy_A08g039527 [Arachis hypogaea]
MDALSRIGFLPSSSSSSFSSYNLQLPRIHVLSRFPSSFSTSISPSVSVLRAPPPSVTVSDVEEDVLQIFLEEREVNGDFISRLSDMLWQRKFRSTSLESYDIGNTSQQPGQITESNIDDDGFLKLSRTQEWVLGENSAPINKKLNAKMLQDSSERRRKLNILKYESLKREILLISIGIGLACSGYCFISLSAQAAVSYGIGVLFSCLYLRLLYQHADNLSTESVAQIFRKKKPKKIGIRSEDLQDSLERLIKGCSMSLSSPRLVIPAAIYGIWVLSHQYFTNDFFDFQLVPAMFGMFVYKAAVLVQVYRDNEDLQLVFPENDLLN